MAPVDMVVGNVLTAIGAAGNICLALAQVPLYLQMYREGSSDKYSPLPSLALSFVMSLWCGYTVWYLPLPAIYVANFSGMVIPFCYLMVHAALASTLKKKVAAFFGTLLALGLSWGFSAGVFVGPGVTNRVDIHIGVTAAFSFGFFIAPLRPLFTALQDLDLSRVSLTLPLVQICQSIIWIFAGFYIGDAFTTWMNSVGLGFAVLQVACWVYIYLRGGKPAATLGKPAATPPLQEAAAVLDVRKPQAGA
jgi:hypothetical protein